jgi:hypothetical protein
MVLSLVHHVQAAVHTHSYSLRPTLLFASMDVSKYILKLDTSILAKINMDRRK